MSENSETNAVEREPQPGDIYRDQMVLVKCCAQLRCKSMFYSGVERPGLLHMSDVLTYWCEDTQDNVGIDRKECYPDLCQPGRECYLEP